VHIQSCIDSLSNLILEHKYCSHASLRTGRTVKAVSESLMKDSLQELETVTKILAQSSLGIYKKTTLALHDSLPLVFLEVFVLRLFLIMIFDVMHDSHFSDETCGCETTSDDEDTPAPHPSRRRRVNSELRLTHSKSEGDLTKMKRNSSFGSNMSVPAAGKDLTPVGAMGRPAQFEERCPSPTSRTARRPSIGIIDESHNVTYTTAEMLLIHCLQDWLSSRYGFVHTHHTPGDGMDGEDEELSQLPYADILEESDEYHSMPGIAPLWERLNHLRSLSNLVHHKEIEATRMLKLSRAMHNWYEVWITVKDGYVCVYKNEQDIGCVAPHDTLPLADFEIEDVEGPVYDNGNVIRLQPILEKDKTHSLSLPSEELKAKWMERLRHRKVEQEEHRFKFFEEEETVVADSDDDDSYLAEMGNPDGEARSRASSRGTPKSSSQNSTRNKLDSEVPTPRSSRKGGKQVSCARCSIQ